MIGVQWFQSRGPWFFPFSTWYGWTPPPNCRARIELSRRNKGNLHPTRRSLSAISAISSTSEAAKPMTAGLYYLMRIVFYCPAEIKEIKEIMLPSLCAALSAISAISAGLKTCRLVGFVLLSRRNKGNEGNLHPTRRSLSAISAISAGHYYLMRIVFYCPAVV